MHESRLLATHNATSTEEWLSSCKVSFKWQKNGWRIGISRARILALSGFFCKLLDRGKSNKINGFSAL
jgi:hypothetical protein